MKLNAGKICIPILLLWIRADIDVLGSRFVPCLHCIHYNHSNIMIIIIIWIISNLVLHGIFSFAHTTLNKNFSMVFFHQRAESSGFHQNDTIFCYLWHRRRAFMFELNYRREMQRMTSWFNGECYVPFACAICAHIRTPISIMKWHADDKNYIWKSWSIFHNTFSSTRKWHFVFAIPPHFAHPQWKKNWSILFWAWLFNNDI